MNYRPEIDGLRSFAILPVLLFHAGFGWMSGGFLGVDVFFVISGYLISSIIIKEHTDARFSLAHFYERRARRILPALFFVLISSTLAAWWWLSPQQLVDFAHSVLATLGFVANIYFWQHIDYFTGDTNLLPLLHLWSLGIEEQFYFLFPLLFILLWNKKERLLGVIAALFMASLLGAHLVDTAQRSAAFYLLPTRAWELIAGAGCAFYLHRKSSPHPSQVNQLGSALGLGVLVASFLLFTPAILHPSLWTLIPVLGTVLIIVCAQPNTLTAKLLSLKPLVWIGLLSYSAYLWHQPLFAFTRITRLQAELPLTITLGLIVLTFLLAAISWRFIEQPFRNRAFLRRKQVFGLSLAAMLGLAAPMLWIQQQQGLPQRFNEVQRILFEHQRLASQQASHDPCFVGEDRDSQALGEECKLNAQQTSALLGDSHASALWYGLNAHIPLAKYSASGCAPLLGDEIKDWRPFCPAVNQFNFSEIEAKQPKLIVLHANWLLYQQKLPQDDPLLIGKQLQNTLAHLHRIAPDSHVFVIGDVPQWPPSLIQILSEQAKHDAPEHKQPNSTYAALKKVEHILQDHMDDKATFISLLDMLCDEEGVCQAIIPTETDWEPLAWDYGHLSRGAAAYVSQQLLPIMKQAVAAP